MSLRKNLQKKMMKMMKMSNTSIRVLVSVFAIPILFLITYLGSWYFSLFVIAISILSFYELSIFSNAKGAKVNLFWGMIGIVAVLLNKFQNFIEDVFVIIVFWFIGLMIIELYRNKGSALLNIGLTSLGFLFFSISGYSLIALREIFSTSSNEYVNGAYLIFSILGTIWVCDSAAFFGGTKVGKHKLFPRVSPNKTWEGAIFGFLTSILFMILSYNLLLEFISFYTALIFGLIIGTLGQIGDLIESLFKRDAGVKDSSNLIPGHGGVFDRFDSLFLSAPFIYYYLVLFG